MDLERAVEAAARAHFDHIEAQRRDEGRHRPDGQPWQWDDLRPIDKQAHRAFVLPIVQATLATIEEEA